jgi:hypothetical protein
MKKQKLSGDDEKDLRKVINYFKKEKPVPSLGDNGNPTLNKVLLLSLRNSLYSPNFFAPKASEKGKRKPGEFIFKSNLLKYYKPEQMGNLLIEVGRKKLINISKDYP